MNDVASVSRMMETIKKDLYNNTRDLLGRDSKTTLGNLVI